MSTLLRRVFYLIIDWLLVAYLFSSRWGIRSLRESAVWRTNWLGFYGAFLPPKRRFTESAPEWLHTPLSAQRFWRTSLCSGGISQSIGSGSQSHRTEKTARKNGYLPPRGPLMRSSAASLWFPLTLEVIDVGIDFALSSFAEVPSSPRYSFQGCFWS